jgi:hypothetical protein
MHSYLLYHRMNKTVNWRIDVCTLMISYPHFFWLEIVHTPAGRCEHHHNLEHCVTQSCGTFLTLFTFHRIHGFLNPIGTPDAKVGYFSLGSPFPISNWHLHYPIHTQVWCVLIIHHDDQSCDSCNNIAPKQASLGCFKIL